MSITFVTSDGERIQCDPRIKAMSKMLETLEIAEGEDTPINVPARLFRDILEFCITHEWTSPEPAGKPIKSKKWEDVVPSEWARTYLQHKSMGELAELTTALDYLDIPSLYSYCCARVAFEFIQNSFAEIQSIYNFHDDLTIDEELDLVREHPWLNEKKF